MNKIYLIGFKYDDFCGDRFSVVAIASTIKKAKDIKQYYLSTSPEIVYEIQEWEIDVLEPINVVYKHTIQIGSSNFKSYRTKPYKIIK